MGKAIGKVLTIIVLVGILGALVWMLAIGGNPLEAQTPSQESATTPEQATALVQKGTIESKVSGPGEVKGRSSERLAMAKYRYYKSLEVPLNTRIPKGTPLVRYTYGDPLVAPYDLVVTETNLPKKEKQELTEDHYLQVTRVDSMNVDISVNENNIAEIHEGQEVDVTLGSDEKRTIKGTVASINQVGTYNTSGSKYTVTVSVPNEDGSILIGMSANLSIKVSEAADVLTVPVSAVKSTDQGTVVTVQHDDGTTEERPVTVGISDGKHVEISGDVHEGERVLLNEVSGPTSANTANAADVSSAR